MIEVNKNMKIKSEEFDDVLSNVQQEQNLFVEMID